MLNLSRFLGHVTAPAALLGPGREAVPLPVETWQVLVKVVESMRAGKAIAVAPSTHCPPRTRPRTSSAPAGRRS